MSVFPKQSQIHAIVALLPKCPITLVTDPDGASRLADVDGFLLEVPKTSAVWAPITYAVVAQLIAYHTAVLKGTDVDQPRNLAKSVTVE